MKKKRTYIYLIWANPTLLHWEEMSASTDRLQQQQQQLLATAHEDEDTCSETVKMVVMFKSSSYNSKMRKLWVN